MTQIPRGSDKLYCPLWRKKMSSVCHTCPWWKQLRGRDPNTGEMIDTWDCAIAMSPQLTLEVAQQARQTCATVASTRDELLKSQQKIQNAVAANVRGTQDLTRAVQIQQGSVGLLAHDDT